MLIWGILTLRSSRYVKELKARRPLNFDPDLHGEVHTHLLSNENRQQLQELITESGVTSDDSTAWFDKLFDRENWYAVLAVLIQLLPNLETIEYE